MISLIAFVIFLIFTPTKSHSVAEIQIPPTDYTFDGTLRRIHTPILMYHYVGALPPDADEYRVNLTTSLEDFNEQLDYLKINDYITVSLYELHAALQNGYILPYKPVILTFDDGHIDHYSNVFPLLQEYNYTGTFFIISGHADRELPGYMTWEQNRQLALAGMSIEPHTKNHPDLRNRSVDFLIYEMLGSLESISAHINSEPRMFAYPAGRYDEQTLQVLVSMPFWRAVTTRHGAYHTTDNHYLLGRLRISGGMGASGLSHLIRTSR